jgi:hypothetical protein
MLFKPLDPGQKQAGMTTRRDNSALHALKIIRKKEASLFTVAGTFFAPYHSSLATPAAVA